MQSKTNQISEIIFITHPAWPIGIISMSKEDKFFRRTPAQILTHFREQILPLIQSKVHGTIVVLIKSPPSLEITFKKKLSKAELKKNISIIRRNSWHSLKRQRKIKGTEKIIAMELQQLVGERLIVAEGNIFGHSEEGIRTEVLKKLKEKRFKLGPKIKITCTGSWKDYCSKNYPEKFATYVEQSLRRKIDLILEQKAIIAMEKRAGNFGPPQPRGLGAKARRIRRHV